MVLEGPDNSKAAKGDTPAPKEGSALSAARTERAPDTAVQSSKPEDVAKRETAMFATNKNGFSFSAVSESAAAPKPGNAAEARAKTEKKDDKAPGVIDLSARIAPTEKGAAVKPAEADPKKVTAPEPAKQDAAAAKPAALTGIDAIIDSSKRHWEDSAKASRNEGTISGSTRALAADVMGLGVDAFKASSDLFNAAFPDGAIEPARQRWQQEAKDGKNEGGIAGHTKKAIASTADGLLALSGLGALEDSAKKVIKGLNDVAPAAQMKDDLKSLAIDTGLAALTKRVRT